MSHDLIFFMGIIFFFLILLILAFKTKRINKSGGIFTGQVLMHDWTTKDKRRAIEYVIEEQERTIKEDDETGEGDKDKGEESNDSNK